ncbi:hypothetical protein Barb4_01292 [Bacteroidales bacterium Barb4]|nr:hypothetical protein Barb4_01292 [Bacteroidales bacterium Barb4]
MVPQKFDPSTIRAITELVIELYHKFEIPNINPQATPNKKWPTLSDLYKMAEAKHKANKTDPMLREIVDLLHMVSEGAYGGT